MSTSLSAVLRALGCLCLGLGLLLPGRALAHRVNVFAWVDGDAIQVECSFSRSNKVRQGKLFFVDAADGQELHAGITDDEGMYRYVPDQNFLATGHPLLIRLEAGEGHQNTWQMEAEELVPLLQSSSRSVDTAGTDQNSAISARTEASLLERTVQERSGSPSPAAQPAFDQAALEASLARSMERVLDARLEAKLAPIRQELARMNDRDPDLRDIVGGTGWIIGLLGLATWLRCKPGA